MYTKIMKEASIKISDALEIFFKTTGITIMGTAPSVTVLEGSDEKEIKITALGGEFASVQKNCFTGKITELTWKSKYSEGYVFCYTIGFLENYNGFLVSASFYNGSNSPVRLKEFSLLKTAENGLTCSGEPSSCWLSTLNWNSTLGNMAEVLSSKNENTKRGFEGWGLKVPFELPTGERYTDGRWRIYDDFLTLYTDSGEKGVAMGPVGTPEADLRYDCKVDNGKMGLEVLSVMNDIILDSGTTRNAQELLVLFEPYETALTTILRWIASTHGQRLHRKPVVGWCSWYDLFKNITEESITATIEGFQSINDRVKLDVIQIDDGYQAQVGNWKCNEKFPNGFKNIISKIKDAGSNPGVWIAPLVIHDSTGLVDTHPDWLQQDKNGAILNKADIFGPTAYWCDPTHPEVLDFVRQIIKDKKQEGFNYFKIDFNAVSERCRFYNPYKTRLQAYRELYALYREEMGEECHLLSCSGFIRGTMGFADSSRIGPDSGNVWEAAHTCTILECIRAVGMNAIANGIVYYNDPDVTYLKSTKTYDPITGEGEGISITTDEWMTWHSFVGLLGGYAMTSDPIQKPEFMSELRMLEILNPPAKEKAIPIRPGCEHNHTQFGFTARRPWGNFASILVWNDKEQARAIELDRKCFNELSQNCFIWSFWDEKFLGIANGGFTTDLLQPHSSQLLRLTSIPEDDELPVLIGSNIHISMGAAELENVSALSGEINIKIADAGAGTGNLYVYSKNPLNKLTASGCRIIATEETENCIWKISIERF